MIPVLLAGLRANVKRWGALGAVIALAVAFLTVSIGVGTLITGKSVRDARAEIAGAGVVVESETAAGLAAATKDATARGAETFLQRTEGRVLRTEARDILLRASPVRPERFHPQTVSAGRLPSARGEIVLPENIARSAGVEVGGTVTLVSPEPVAYRLVGTVPDARIGLPPAILAPSDFAPVDESVAIGALLLVAGGESASMSTTRQYTVQSPDFIAERAGDASMGRASTAPFLLFAVIALVVAVVVISTTMSVLTARRAKELALLRLVGASRRAVAGGVLLEALILGAAASAVGLGIGVGVLGIAVLAVPELAGVSFIPPFVLLGAAWGLGVLATSVGARPAVRLAGAVRPLQAVSDDASRLEEESRSRLWPWLAAAACVAGLAGTWGLAVRHALIPATLLGAASALASLPVFVRMAPRLTAVLLRAVRRSPAARLAAGGVQASPRRAGSTSAALFIGVTLVTMMLTAVSTGRDIAFKALDHDAPFDVTVGLADYSGVATGPGEDTTPAGQEPTLRKIALAPGALERIRALPGVAGADVLKPVWKGEPTEPVAQRIVYALPAEIGTVARGDISHLKDGEIYGVGVNEDADSLPKRLSGPGGSIDVGTPIRAGMGTEFLAVTHGTAAQLGSVTVPNTPDMLAVRLTEGLDAEAIGRVRAQIATIVGVDRQQVSGAAEQRRLVDEGLNVLLGIALSLLGISVVIALMGVADSLTLSQLERSREVSLLRALGMSRRGVAGIVTWESLGITAAALIAGLPLGVFYGWAGAVAAVPYDTLDSGSPVLNWQWIVVTVLGGLIVALASSMLPALRSARVTPSEGLSAP
ncbi:FtsX-like permease family protein [Falsarthrobacter nasiphocae]|uniref:ABC transport system permease protein n=1 Tax=Falsarthrobacter nasiphocae TaxID=189863 RepID=A0AAE3YIH6_9MICC|nr:FtsX-like permease family protein [Falsarthrobacter nasiphocae]MDR6892820.1 putative ABC transport system permease protein [Falsarthrobacter nasiphocae]